jgi:hypothetical protein
LASQFLLCPRPRANIARFDRSLAAKRHEFGVSQTEMGIDA